MWLDKYESRFGRLALPHLTWLLLAGQVLFFIMGATARVTGILDLMVLDAAKVLEQNEIWRLVTFLFIPPQTHPIWLIFAWYLFFIMGTALENEWGVFRFNLFILIGWLATVAIAFLPPGLPVTNEYLLGSVFLAFAYRFPDFQILLFFILPVKIKWLALVTWVFYFYAFVTEGWTERFTILAATANFLLFFGGDILSGMRQANRRMIVQAAALPKLRTARHTCRVCGANSLSEPDMDFRYCTDCKPAQCYCPKHLDLHAHTREPPA
ncbi:MAG: hypothetical protein R6X19_05025 [Kiritimatiellia bacterium]